MLLFLLAAIGAQAQGGFVRARVRSFKEVARIYAGPGVFVPKINQLLEPGNKIETGQNGRVVISLNDGGSQITVLPNSNVVLKNFRDAQSVRELLDIVVGRVIVKIHHIGGKPNPYRLNSPAASIAVRGTEFIVDVLPGGETLVLVREGLVEVWSHNNPDNKRMVTPGSRVIVRPGGIISLAFPGPGSGLSGRTRFNLDLGEDYQRSVDSVAQNSNEISPVFFSAFPDQHLDSLENPAYAAEFKNAEGRILLLPSISKPYLSDVSKHTPRFDYSISPQLTFYTPIPGSRLVVGGSASTFDVKSQELIDSQSPFVPTGYKYYYSQVLRFNAFNASLIAAYNFGDRGKTSVGIGIDRLSGDGTFASIFNNVNVGIYHKDGSTFNISQFDREDSNAWFSRTRLTLGLVRRFSESKKIGFYYRHGRNSSDQLYDIYREYEDKFQPKTSYIAFGKIYVSTHSSELGARFRASLTKRLFYGVEGSYLYERINSRRDAMYRPVARNYYLARRARLGVGLGFALTSKILLNLDMTGGIFNNDRPMGEPVNLGGNFFSSTSYPSSPRSAQGTSVSAHSAVQSNPWRNLLLSFSNLTTLSRDLVMYNYNYNGTVYTYGDMRRDLRPSSSIGVGWKFTPNLITEYLFSMDHRYTPPSHSLKLRYTFNLNITGEK
jgi:FecR-like protein